MTINDIIAIGRQIAAETAEGGNTAARVGGVIEAIGEILKNQDYMSWQPAGNFDIEEYYEKNDQVFDTETNSCYVSLQTDNVGHPVNENDESYEEGWWMKVIDGASVLAAAAAATQAAAEANQAAEAARGIVYQAVDDHLDTESLKPVANQVVTQAINNLSENLQDVEGEIMDAQDIDVNSFTPNRKYINSSNAWANGVLAQNHAYSINIPVSAGDIYIVEAAPEYGSIYALLRSNTTIGNPVDFSESQYGRVVMTAGERKRIIIPDDTTILYIFLGNTLKDSSMTFVADFRPQITQYTKPSSHYHTYSQGVMMGDSVTYGVYSYYKNSQRWNGVELLNSIADYIGKITDTTCTNIGKRGTGYVADTRNVNNAWELAQITDYTNIDYVVMMYGVNDYIRGVALGTIAENLENTIVGNMTRTLNKIYSDNPNCKVICVGSYNTWGQVSQGGDYTSNVYYGDESTDYGLGYAINGHTLRDVLNIQKEVCEHYHVQFVCLADEGVVNNFNIKNTLVDGLHPTLDIRKVIAQEIAKHLI